MTMTSESAVLLCGSARSRGSRKCICPCYCFRYFVLLTILLLVYAVTPVQSFLHEANDGFRKYFNNLRHPRKQSPPSPTPLNPKEEQQSEKKLDTKFQTIDAKAAVIVPGFLMGESDFQPLAESLTKRGIPTVVVPMPAWHWIPCCFGKKSVRPILERVDYTVRHVSACIANNQEIVVPKFEYSWIDCYHDCFHNIYGPAVDDVYGDYGDDKSNTLQQKTVRNISTRLAQFAPHGKFPLPPSPTQRIKYEEEKYGDTEGEKGKQSSHFTNYPTTKAKIQPRIALIGHSAGGLVSRIYLSNRPYAGGRAFRGSEFVHSLVTLGTPHGNVQGPNIENIHWCNQEPPLPVRGLAVGAIGTPGHCSGSLTEGAYTFSSIPKTSDNHDDRNSVVVDGDGMITIESALSLKGENVQHQILEDVTHYPWSKAGIWAHLVAPELAQQHLAGKPWYGDDHVVDEWVDFIVNHTNTTTE